MVSQQRLRQRLILLFLKLGKELLGLPVVQLAIALDDCFDVVEVFGLLVG